MRIVFFINKKIFFFFYFRHSESSLEKQPISLQIASSMETIIEKNILQQAGQIRGLHLEKKNSFQY